MCRDRFCLVLGAVRRTDQHDQLGTLQGACWVVTGVGDLREALDLTSCVYAPTGGDLFDMVGEMNCVEESHSVPVEREVEGGRQTTVA